MKLFFQKYYHSLFFICLFLSICWFYNFDEIFHFGPRSTHQWRQSDSASLALNYYQDGMNFFKPRVHYAMGGEGYVTGVGEAPIFYYLVAAFYKLFGPHDGIFRLLSLLTLLIGFYLISKIVLKETGDLFLSVLVPAFLMGSPIIAFYSFNFTPNVPAQGFAMIGIWFFYLFYKNSRQKYFYWSLFFCAIAGLIKLSALITFLTIFSLWLIEFFKIYQLKNTEKVFQNNLKTALSFSAVFFLIILWRLFAEHFNEVHQVNYFLSKMRPIWSIDEATRESIWTRIVERRIPSFFNNYTFWLLSFLGVLLLITPRKQKVITYFAYLSILLGTGSFFILMFTQFKLHDYYVIELMLLPLSILFGSAIYLNQYLPRISKKWWFRSILGIALIFNISYTKNHLDSSYDLKKGNNSHFNTTFYQKEALQDFIKRTGIQKNDKVISAPDHSPNISLYYLNLHGWTEYFLNDQINASVVRYLLSAGAKYLIINDKKYLEIEKLKPFLEYPLGDFENSIFVFDIRPYALPELEIEGSKND